MNEGIARQPVVAHRLLQFGGHFEEGGSRQRAAGLVLAAPIALEFGLALHDVVGDLLVAAIDLRV